MPSVRLIPIDPDLAAALDQGPDRFEADYDAALAEAADIAADAVRQTLAMPAAASPPWCGYLAADPSDRVVIGTCAFKSPPDGKGAVEIAYFTFPAYEGRGYGSAMAGALVAIASMSPRVSRIVAHTLAEPNASTRILEKVGMTRTAEFVDPDDGPVWRWEMAPRR